MTKEEFVRKITSRKFWICTAAFLASVAASVAGISGADKYIASFGMVCGVVSAAIYAAAEAYVDANKTGKETEKTEEK